MTWVTFIATDSALVFFSVAINKWEPQSRRSTCIYIKEKLDAFILFLDYMVPIYGYRKRHLVTICCIIILRQA